MSFGSGNYYNITRLISWLTCAVIPWVDSPVYPPRHYSVDSLSSSDIGIVRTHPPNYYEQYGNQYGQQYEGASQYSNPQYGLVYPKQTYYNAPEKRFMVSRKRSQVTLWNKICTQFVTNHYLRRNQKNVIWLSIGRAEDTLKCPKLFFSTILSDRFYQFSFFCFIKIIKILSF